MLYILQNKNQLTDKKLSHNHFSKKKKKTKNYIYWIIYDIYKVEYLLTKQKSKGNQNENCNNYIFLDKYIYL